MDKTELLKYTITRFDHYYDSVNNKGNVYLTLMIFLIGGTIGGFYCLNEKNGCTEWEWAFFYLILIIQLSGIVLTLIALRPYVKSGTSKLSGSILFFGDISSYTLEEYKTLISERTNEKLDSDLITQVYALAIGLHQKYAVLRLATSSIAIQLFLMVILGLIIYK